MEGEPLQREHSAGCGGPRLQLPHSEAEAGGSLWVRRQPGLSISGGKTVTIAYVPSV